MARQLDPKLQKIIEDASNGSHSSDMDYSSTINVDFAKTALNRHLSRQQHREEPGFLAAGFQTSQSMLDDFGSCHLSVCLVFQLTYSHTDRDVLRSNNAYRPFEQSDRHSRLSLPPSGTNNNPVKAVPQSLYGHQITQQHQRPVDEITRIRGPRDSVVGDRKQRPQPPQTPLHNPVAIFHGIDKLKPTLPLYQEPTTPFNLCK
jgi:hypothetical protein